MEKVYASVPASEKSKNFFDSKTPDGVSLVSVCSSSGELAGAGCSVVKEYYKNSRKPTAYCHLHSAPKATEKPTDENENQPENQPSENGENGGEQTTPSENTENNVPAASPPVSQPDTTTE